jgi:hypothetical protein
MHTQFGGEHSYKVTTLKAQKDMLKTLKLIFLGDIHANLESKSSHYSSLMLETEKVSETSDFKLMQLNVITCREESFKCHIQAIIMEIGSEGMRWMELVQDCVQQWGLVLAMLRPH